MRVQPVRMKPAGLSPGTTKMVGLLFTHHPLYNPEILGVWFDKKPTFKEHAKWAAAKAGRIARALYRTYIRY